MSYLFIGGAPRSGTSALTELLSSHPEIALGMERFKYLYFRDQVTPELFEAARFFSFTRSETNMDDSSGKYVDYYAQLKKKFDSCSIVGDKYPQLYRALDTLHARFGGRARFIVIVHDVFDVASSFNVRAMKPNDSWPAKNDYRLAVELWNGSLVALLASLRTGSPVIAVNYESLFDRERSDTCAQRRGLLELIGVDDHDDIASRHALTCKTYGVKVKPKPRVLTDSEEDYVDSHARFDLLRELAEAVPGRGLSHLDRTPRAEA